MNTNKRFIKCFHPPKDVTLIEILKSDEITEDKFLFPDLNYKNGFQVYENQNFYLAGYPKVADQFIGDGHISSGKIRKIKILNLLILWIQEKVHQILQYA